jgi:hypothetical protein
MERIGKYFDRQVFWLDYINFTDQLPDNNWVCLAIANKQPNLDIFDNFARTSISKNILEFKGCGQFGEILHHLFDKTMVIMETNENYSFIEVVTTSHNDEIIADAFWQCFFATSFKDTANLDDIVIVCTDLDNVNRNEELTYYIKEFELGWLPSKNL